MSKPIDPFALTDAERTTSLCSSCAGFCKATYAIVEMCTMYHKTVPSKHTQMSLIEELEKLEKQCKGKNNAR